MTTRDDDKFRSDFENDESTDEVIRFLNGEATHLEKVCVIAQALPIDEEAEARIDKIIAENKKEEYKEIE